MRVVCGAGFPFDHRDVLPIDARRGERVHTFHTRLARRWSILGKVHLEGIALDAARSAVKPTRCVDVRMTPLLAVSRRGTFWRVARSIWTRPASIPSSPAGVFRVPCTFPVATMDSTDPSASTPRKFRPR